MSLQTWPAAIAVFTVCLACSDTAVGDERSETTNSSMSETETEGDSESSESSETSEGEDVCELPANASPDAAVPISIRNDRDVAIYAMPYSSFGCNYAQVEIDIDGAPVLWHHAGTYAYDCSGELCGWGCSDGGAMGLIINPGETAELSWSGGYWASAALPEACMAELGCDNDPGDSCQALELVDPGTPYTVRVNLSETCPVDDECMACTEGVCEVFFYEPEPGSETVEASASFPEGAALVVG